MRKATRTQWIKVGTDRSSFHLRHLHHQKDSLVVLEEI